MNPQEKILDLHGTQGTRTEINGTKLWSQEDPPVPVEYRNNILEGSLTSRYPVNEASTLYKGDSFIVVYSIVN
jgi:hypothetical protein